MTNFAFSTKARTLETLARFEVEALLCEQIIIGHDDWTGRQAEVLSQTARRFSGRLLAVRSSAMNEDGEESSLAGAFLSLTSVVAEEAALKRAIQQVFDSYTSPSPGDEVLIQPMVENVVISGVVLTRELDTGGPYIVIDYDDFSGRTDTVTSGGESKTLLVHRARQDAITSPRFAKLLNAVAQLEAITRTDKLDIEFCIDASDDVFILQVRPLAAKKRWKGVADKTVDSALDEIRRDVRDRLQPRPELAGETTMFGEMPDWNPAEIIGSAPSPLALSLYKHLITDWVWAQARADLGYNHVALPLLADFRGRPFIDVRLSLNSFLPAGLPRELSDRIVRFQLQALKDNPALHDKIEFEIATTCKTFDFENDRQRLQGAGLAADEIAFTRDAYQMLTRRIVDGGIERIAQDLALGEVLAKPMKPGPDGDMGAVAGMLELIISNGTLPFARLARDGFVAVSFLKSLERLGIFSEADTAAFMRTIRTVTAELLYDFQAVSTGVLSSEEFMRRYGHLRPGTYDIQSWRYDEQPDILLSNLQFPQTVEHKAEFTLSAAQRREIARLLDAEGYASDPARFFEYISLAIRAREQSKFHFTKALSDVLSYLAEWGQRRSFSREDLSFLTIDMLLADPDRAAAADMVARNRADFEVTKMIRLPHLIFEPSDIDVVRLPIWQPNFISSDAVTAAAVVVEKNTSPALYGKIVLIESADPGFDWIFSHNIAGLVTEYGGANSHMAIRCAELGVPAAIGCGERLFAILKASQAIELNCANRIVRPARAS